LKGLQVVSVQVSLYSRRHRGRKTFGLRGHPRRHCHQNRVGRRKHLRQSFRCDAPLDNISSYTSPIWKMQWVPCICRVAQSASGSMTCTCLWAITEPTKASDPAQHRSKVEDFILQLAEFESCSGGNCRIWRYSPQGSGAIFELPTSGTGIGSHVNLELLHHFTTYTFQHRKRFPP
jgi:hypothetical protein